MRLEQLPTEFEAARPVIQQIEAAGFVAYFVGGSVRDTLLKQDIHDIDIATDASPQEIKQIFRRTVDVGIEHGTVLVLYHDNQYEITTFRTEESYQDYRRPEKVTFVRSLTEDLKRRDFTINALALTQAGELVDLFHGLDDLQAGIIRAVGNPEERFNEDALRMMRAVRFVSQLNFSIEAETLSAIKRHYKLLGKISVERLQVELTKLLMGKNRQQALLDFIETNCYQCCPGFEQQKEQLLELAALANKLFSDEVSAWTLVCHFLKIEPDQIVRFLKSWKFSNQFSKAVQTCLGALNWRLTHEWDAWTVYSVGLTASQRAEQLLFYFDLPIYQDRLIQLEHHLPIHSIKNLNINGQLLAEFCQKKPGPWVGRMLKRLEYEVVNNKLINETSALLNYVQENLLKEES